MDNRRTRNLNKFYEKIERVIREAEERFGKKEEEIKTDDKLSEETKGIIEKRNNLIFKSNKTNRTERTIQGSEKKYKKGHKQF